MDTSKIQQRIEEYEPRSDYTPLRVIFKTTTPVCIAHPWIAFDGLLAHTLLRKILGDDYRALPSKAPADVSSLKLPVKKFQKSDKFFYHASISFFDVQDHYRTVIYKRFHEKDLYRVKQLRKKKIVRGSGHFRDFMISLVYVPCRSVTFYVNGDKKEIRELCRAIPSIGKKSAIGFGEITSVEISEIDRDRSIIYSGKAMRPIPQWAFKSAEEKWLLAYIFPYWSRRNVDLCAVPSRGVKMKNA